MHLLKLSMAAITVTVLLGHSTTAQTRQGASGPTIDAVTYLNEMEAIQQLKARYFRYVDTGHPDLITLFTAPMDFYYTDTGKGMRFDSLMGLKPGAPRRAALVSPPKTLAELARPRRVHHGHNGDIQFTSPVTATGVWTFSDIDGEGHYYEEYVKGPQGWHIAVEYLSRLRFDPNPSATSVAALSQTTKPTARIVPAPAGDGTAAIVSRLTDTEQLKQLQARYFRFIDTKHWSDLRSLLAADMQFQSEDPVLPSQTGGADAFVAYLSKYLADAVTVHHGHMPEIQIVSSTTATGIWALQDWIDFTKTKPQERSFRGYGHYFVDYVKDGDGTWRIKKVRLTRLKIDPYTGPPPPEAANQKP
jgi:hypothetical protein